MPTGPVPTLHRLEPQRQRVRRLGLSNLAGHRRPGAVRRRLSEGPADEHCLVFELRDIGRLSSRDDQLDGAPAASDRLPRVEDHQVIPRQQVSRHSSRHGIGHSRRGRHAPTRGGVPAGAAIRRLDRHSGVHRHEADDLRRRPPRPWLLGLGPDVGHRRAVRPAVRCQGNPDDERLAPLPVGRAGRRIAPRPRHPCCHDI
jgi:hypothetical protein